MTELPFAGLVTAPFPWTLPPALVFFAGALLVALVRGRLQAWLALAVPLVSLWSLLGLDLQADFQVAILGFRLDLLRIDRLSFLFGLLFHVAAIIGVLYAWHVRSTVQQANALLYAGGALGAVFAGDLITLFLFWELMAVGSVFLIWARRSSRSAGAGQRYLLIQVTSGMLLLAGTLVRLSERRSLDFSFIGLDGLSSWLIFLAFGIKCAFPLLHNWLTDAYPEATPTGAVFLSAFTTKIAVYALARSFPGTEALIYIGAAMTAFPIFYAVIENDLRRVLAYSMINQIGFMVVGIGLGTTLGLNGAVSHAFNDVIFKGLLFMSMGAVLHMTGRINGTDLGGLYKTMPLTATLCLVGAASISAFPLFAGFVSKSMVMVSVLEEGYTGIWLVLLFASAGVFHHAGIKIPYFAFFAHDSGIRSRDPPWNMLLAMFIAAGLCIFNGSFPALLYSLLPWPVDYLPYTATHVLAQTQLLFFSALAFAWLMLSGLYPPELKSVNLDAEWFYRRLGRDVVGWLGRWIERIDRGVRDFALWLIGRLLSQAAGFHAPQGHFARAASSSRAAAVVVMALGVMLVIYYF